MFGIVASSAFGVQYATLQYVGGRSDNVASTTISLTGLSGGIASSPSTGDLVIVVFGKGQNNALETSPISVTGYTQISNIAALNSSGDDLYFYVGYKRLTTAETSLSLVGLTTTESAVAIHVWRNTDATTPIDAGPGVITSNNARPTNQSITPVTQNAVVISTVGIGSDTANAVWSNSSLSNVVSAADDSTTGQECHVGIGSTLWAGGATNIPIWTSTDTDPSYAGASVTFALRPAAL